MKPALSLSVVFCKSSFGRSIDTVHHSVGVFGTAVIVRLNFVLFALELLVGNLAAVALGPVVYPCLLFNEFHVFLEHDRELDVKHTFKFCVEVGMVQELLGRAAQLSVDHETLPK